MPQPATVSIEMRMVAPARKEAEAGMTKLEQARAVLLANGGDVSAAVLALRAVMSARTVRNAAQQMQHEQRGGEDTRRLAARVADGDRIAYRPRLPRLTGAGVTCVGCGDKHWPLGAVEAVAGPAPATVWDHCHEHGTVRAPLCIQCNRLMADVDAAIIEGTANLLKVRARCTRCSPRPARVAAWWIEARARSALAQRLVDEQNWYTPCACCPIVQTLYAIPPRSATAEKDRLRSQRRSWRSRVAKEWSPTSRPTGPPRLLQGRLDWDAHTFMADFQWPPPAP